MEIRHQAIRVWMKVFPVPGESETNAHKDIQKRLKYHLLKKVKENFVEMYFPPATSILINILGFSKREEDTGEKLFRDDFFDVLRQYFEPAFQKNKDIALRMLPSFVEYNEKTGELIENHPFKRNTILPLRTG